MVVVVVVKKLGRCSKKILLKKFDGSLGVVIVGVVKNIRQVYNLMGVWGWWWWGVKKIRDVYIFLGQNYNL